MKKLHCLIAIIGLSMILTASLTVAQELDGKWFKVTYSTKGYWSGESRAVEGAVSDKVVNYLQFVYNDRWAAACPEGYTPQFYPFYEIHMWYPVGGAWNLRVQVGLTSGNCTDMIFGCPYSRKHYFDKQFVTLGVDGYFHFEGDGVEEGLANAMTVLAIKRDSAGKIKSASFNSLGCFTEAYKEGFAGAYRGSCTIKGKLINIEKLPVGLSPAGAGPHYTEVEACAAP